MKPYPLLFKSNLHPVVWGGSKLRPYKGLAPTGEPIGESWEVSAVPTSISVIANGEWQGRDVTKVIKEHPEDILGKAVSEKYGGKLPLLVKFIDARRDLSIQVHPNDEMALREHGKMGKSEMWYVIKADEGSFLYAGFKQEIRPEEYQRHIAEGTITDGLTKHTVKPGDVFYIPAGRVHAICDVTVSEPTVAEINATTFPDASFRNWLFSQNYGADGKLTESEIRNITSPYLVVHPRKELSAA